MAKAILTLNYPADGRGYPVATTRDPRLLQQFREVVLDEWRWRAEADDEVLALLNRLEMERLERALALLIPPVVTDEDDEEATE